MYAFDLAGKVAVVTGAASGLGNEYVETLARQGCDVALVDYDLRKQRRRQAASPGKQESASVPMAAMWAAKRTW